MHQLLKWVAKHFSFMKLTKLNRNAEINVNVLGFFTCCTDTAIFLSLTVQLLKAVVIITGVTLPPVDGLRRHNFIKEEIKKKSTCLEKHTRHFRNTRH